MKYLPFIILSILCVGMGTLYTIFHKKIGWQGIILRGLSILSFLILAVVSANSKELNNALPMFVMIALGLNIMSETLLASNNVDEKARLITFSLLNFASVLLFAVSSITLSEFNVLALVGGILAGIGLGLIICGFKKNWAIEPILMEILVSLSLGLLLGFSLTATIVSKHFVSGILMLIGSILMFAKHILESFCGKYKIMGYIINAIFMISLLIMTMTIYFF